jgi:hypothetical protein
MNIYTTSQDNEPGAYNRGWWVLIDPNSEIVAYYIDEDMARHAAERLTLELEAETRAYDGRTS